MTCMTWLTTVCCIVEATAFSVLVTRKEQFLRHCAASLLTHFLCIIQPHPTDASTAITNGLFHTGFGIATTNYQSYAQLLSEEVGIPTLLVADVDESDGTAFSLQYDAASLLAYTPKKTGTGDHLLLLGHSRGGAVAALAATQRETEALVLLDPVDTSDGFVAAAITGAHATNVRVPHNVLIVSTPYGGKSSYYRVRYESACAPTGRNGDNFEVAYRSVMHHEGKLLHVTLPNVGHTQLLDDRQGSVLASVCATNAAVADDDVRILIQTLMKEWIKSIQTATNDDNDKQGNVPALIEKITLQFPNIELTYTVDK